MSSLSRREALTAVVAGGVAAAVAAPASAATAAVSRKSQLASVAHTRSFDQHVFLEISPELKGWAHFDKNPFAHGIAAACQLAGKKVHMTYASHDPKGIEGNGKFEGVKRALQEFEG